MLNFSGSSVVEEGQVMRRLPLAICQSGARQILHAPSHEHWPAVVSLLDGRAQLSEVWLEVQLLLLSPESP